MRCSASRRWADRGFTLVELLITISIIAIAAALVVPQMADDQAMRLEAAARVLVSDIELAQVLTIAQPDRPVVVRFDGDTQTYWLAYASDPDTPLPRGDTGDPYEVTLGLGRASAATDVTMAVFDMEDDTLTFNEQGGVEDMNTRPVIRLVSPARAIELHVTPTTGTIKEVAVAVAY
jgi:prepilin-type N-terminal cleavage/methylation domain-containing protein